MPRGYRFLVAAACGLALFAALGTGAFFGSLYSPGHKQYQTVAGDQGRRGDYTGPSQSLPDISGLPGPVERAIANPHPATGNDNEKRDLAAQEASALWAFWMVVASFASVLITAVGTIFLYKQIVLTREAVEDTGKATDAMLKQIEITEREQRPWVLIEAGKPAISNRDDGILITVEIGFKNIGKTVAAGFWPHLKCYLTGADFEESVRDNFAEIRKPRGVTDRILMPGETCTLTAYIVVPVKSVPWFGDVGEKRINAVMQAAVFYYVDGAVHYDARLHTERVFRIGTFDADQPFHKYVLIRKAAENPAKHDFVSTVSGPLATAR